MTHIHFLLGLCASLSCAAASRHESNQIRHQGVFQANPPATRWVSSGKHNGTPSGNHFTVLFLFVLFYHLICWTAVVRDCTNLTVPVGFRCSCGRWSVNACRPYSIRKSCGVLSHCSAASGPSWRESTLSTWDDLPVSSRWDAVFILVAVVSFIHLNNISNSN